MKKIVKKPLVAAIGTAAVSLWAQNSLANATANPFAMQELTRASVQLAAVDSAVTPGNAGAAKAGEMACGANMRGMKKDEMGKANGGQGHAKKPKQPAHGAVKNQGSAPGQVSSGVVEGKTVTKSETGPLEPSSNAVTSQPAQVPVPAQPVQTQPGIVEGAPVPNAPTGPGTPATGVVSQPANAAPGQPVNARPGQSLNAPVEAEPAVNPRK